MVALTSLITSAVLIYLALIVLNIGDGLFERAKADLFPISRLHMQGRLGANQGMQSLPESQGLLLRHFLRIR